MNGFSDVVKKCSHGFFRLVKEKSQMTGEGWGKMAIFILAGDETQMTLIIMALSAVADKQKK